MKALSAVCLYSTPGPNMGIWYLRFKTRFSLSNCGCRYEFASLSILDFEYVFPSRKGNISRSVALGVVAIVTESRDILAELHDYHDYE